MSKVKMMDGTEYEWVNITVPILGVEMQGIKSISYDENGNRIEENITHEEAEKRILNNR